MKAIAEPPLLYTRAESEAAHREWRANCGPHALAAALGKSLEQIRRSIAFKGWMNPTMIGEALRACGQLYMLTKGLRTTELCNGINRVQWEGPWLDAGRPPAAAYAHTHWVAHFNGWVLCAACAPAEWLPISAWKAIVAAEYEPWHITHHYQFEHRLLGNPV